MKPECRERPSAPDTLYGRGTCTVVISFNGGSEFRLFMTTGRAARKRPGAPELRETTVLRKRRFPRALNQRTPLPIWKSLQTTPVLSRSETPVGQPQAGAAAHACTDYEARTASANPSGPCVTPALPAFSKPDIRHPPIPAARRSRKAKQGGAGGIISPALH